MPLVHYSEGPWDSWEGLKCQWLSPGRNMERWWQRQLKVAEDAGLKSVPWHTFLDLSLFLPPLWVWLFPPVAFFPSVLHIMTGIFSSFCVFFSSLGLNDVTSIVVNQNKCCHERKAHGMLNGRPLFHSVFAYAVCFSGVLGREGGGWREERKLGNF